MKSESSSRRSFPVAWVLLLAFSYSLSAADFYVSPEGNDSDAGTAQTPLRTLRAARDRSRTVAGRESVTVYVADGTYYLDNTLVFTPADSGSETHPVVYRAANEGKSVLSGGMALNLAWKPWKNGILQASTPPGLAFDQLFVNGLAQRMARYPNYDPKAKTKAYNGFAADALSPERAAGWSDPIGGFIHAMHQFLWGGFHYRITGKDAANVVTYEGGWQNNRPSPMHPQMRMVENIFEELDAPGEWFLDQKTSTLYFYPPEGMEMAKARVEVVRLRHLIEFQGNSTAPVEYITLDGFTLRHAARTFLETRDPLLRSDWTIYRGGAVLFNGARECTVANTEFDQLGGNALFVNNWNRQITVKGCHFHDIGASAVAFVGSPDSVRHPRVNKDNTPGPQSDDYPDRCLVEDSLIHGIGRVEKQTAGVQLSMSAHVTVRDCSIYDTARAGINISEGTFGGHIIERCDVFDTVLETADHGSFNSWGRDRYWGTREQVNPAFGKNPALPFLDMVDKNVIRDSRWRCDHGWGIDLDDGSSNYEIDNNLVLRGGIKLREGFRRKATNNVLLGRFSFHMWYDNSQDIVARNIVTEGYSLAGMHGVRWGTGVDYNLFASSETERLLGADQGADPHSLVGDPLFMDPAKGDFRVRPESPALKLGFHNFPMDQFGVKKASLKAIASTPTIPQIKVSPDFRRPTETELKISRGTYRAWMGGFIHAIEGDEFSAFGVSAESGGVAIMELPSGSALERTGLRAGDLIQGLNAVQVKNVADLAKALKTATSNSRITVVRNQNRMELATNATLDKL